MLKAVYIAVGWVSLALGALGIVLPLLPTTPFLLLSAFCFARSSERFYTYLTEHPVLGEYVRNYRERTMKTKDKVRTLALMWLSIVVSAVIIGKLATWIVLPTIAVAVTVHILSLRPATAEATEDAARGGAKAEKIDAGQS